MNYYSQLLTAAFRALTNDQSPTSLALAYVETEQSDAIKRSSDAPLRLPSDSLPQNADLRYLGASNTFLENAIAIAADSEAKCAFVCPPILGQPCYSSDWNEHQAMLGYPEAVANNLLNASNVQTERTSRNAVEVLAMLVPNNFASSPRTSQWRHEFFSAHSAVVIEHEHADLPRALGLNVDFMARFTTVIFQRKAGPIRFFKITDTAVADGPEKIAKDLGQLLRQPAGKTRYGYVYQGVLDPEYPCSYDYYSEETEKLRQEVAVLGEKVPLESIAEILTGFTASKSSGDDTSIDFLLISARDITAEGKVDLSEISRYHGPARIRHYLQEGDFCMRKICTPDGRLFIGVTL